MLVECNSFVGRQTKESPFSHFEGTSDELLKLVEDNWDKRKPSYRKNKDGEDEAMEGVVLVPVPAEGFFTGLTVLKDGDKLIGEYSPRTEGEEPRKHVYVKQVPPPGVRGGAGISRTGGKTPAAFVDIVCYAGSVLAETNHQETYAEYEIVSINARVSDEEQPIHPETLMHNHFGSDGGTDTNMNDSEFVEQLRESFVYWKDKALLEAR